MASTLLILICPGLCLIYQHAPTLGLRLAQRRMVAHPVVKNLPSDAGDTGSVPRLRRFHMLCSSKLMRHKHGAELWSPRTAPRAPSPPQESPGAATKTAAKKKRMVTSYTYRCHSDFLVSPLSQSPLSHEHPPALPFQSQHIKVRLISHAFPLASYIHLQEFTPRFTSLLHALCKCSLSTHASPVIMTPRISLHRSSLLSFNSPSFPLLLLSYKYVQIFTM